MRCVFCKTEEDVARAPAFSKAGRYIREGRVFVVPACAQDREVADQSFDTPFTDKEVIDLYKKTIEV